MYLVAGILALSAALFMFVLHYKYSLAKKIMQSVPEPTPADLNSSINHLYDRARETNTTSETRKQNWE